MVPFPWKSEANICSHTLCKNQSFTLPWKKTHVLWFMTEEKKLRFSLTSCSTPSTCLMYCLQLCFLWKVSACVSTAPNRLTETDEFFLCSQLFLFFNCYFLLFSFNPFIALSICVQFYLHWFKILGHFLMVNISSEIPMKNDLTLWWELLVFWVWTQRPPLELRE